MRISHEMLYIIMIMKIVIIIITRVARISRSKIKIKIRNIESPRATVGKDLFQFHYFLSV